MKIGIISDTHGLLRPEDILKAMLNAEIVGWAMLETAVRWGVEISSKGQHVTVGQRNPFGLYFPGWNNMIYLKRCMNSVFEGVLLLQELKSCNTGNYPAKQKIVQEGLDSYA